MADSEINSQFGKGASSKYSGANPYARYYSSDFGYVFGRPFGFMEETDPSNRVFQNLLLKNNTIVSITPGAPGYNLKTVQEVEARLKDMAKRIDEIRASDKSAEEKEAASVREMLRVQGNLISSETDMRMTTFQKKVPEFLTVFKQLVTQVGVSIFGGGFISTGLDVIIESFQANLANTGFNLWTEKSTSISESASNSYTDSVLQAAQQSVSDASKQLQQGLGAVVGASNDPIKIESNSEVVSKLASAVSNASASITGANFQHPKFWSNSDFTRNYNISFRFVSPYGDNLSVFFHVIMPFLFILCFALPRQFGPSGMDFPFILQLDCPGFFSCPMGCVTSVDFKKGGDNFWFNASGLPLVIDGSLTVVDLYNALSLPANYAETLVNIGTRSFLNTLGGLTLYDTLDPTLSKSITTRLLELFKLPTYPIEWGRESIAEFQRYFGLVEKNTDRKSVV